MSRMQRDKGKRGELEVAKLYTAEGFDVRRLGNAGRYADLGGLSSYAIHPEVKCQGQVRIVEWMRQTEEEASDLQTPALHWRLCRRGNNTGWYVNVPIADWLDLLKKAHA